MKVESLDSVATGGQHFLLDRNTRRSACVTDSVVRYPPYLDIKKHRLDDEFKGSALSFLHIITLALPSWVTSCYFRLLARKELLYDEAGSSLL
jgi:hypothetical protein